MLSHHQSEVKRGERHIPSSSTAGSLVPSVRAVPSGVNCLLSLHLFNTTTLEVKLLSHPFLRQEGSILTHYLKVQFIMAGKA